MKISTILDQIDLGSVALPEFQRGYVWNREQVRGLMHSLYRKHPVGSLLVWETKSEQAESRGDHQLATGTVKLLLDGQQRVTSLYGIIRGQPPAFFDGHAQAFTGLYFNLDDEVFEFYQPTKMADDPKWINVTELMQQGAGAVIPRIAQDAELSQELGKYINRLNAIDQIKAIDLHIEEVVGPDKTVDVVVDLFNRVNSGGTKLSKGDLALARICAHWPEARDEMKTRLSKWNRAGFKLELDWFLRCINAVLTGEALFSALKDVTTAEFRSGLAQAEKSIDTLFNMIGSRLGLDHDRVLGGRYAFPVMARYLTQRGGKIADAHERDKLLYWYIHSFLWGRFSGTTETMINQDLEAIEGVTPKDPADGLDQLISRLRRNRGDLRLNEADFGGSTKGNRFYPLLYMMTRVCHSRDWGSGDELTAYLLGNLSKLQVHHIFPKALLRKHGYSRKQINAIANFTFLTQDTNLEISKKPPAEYIPDYETRNPGAVASHWIPMDPQLCRVERYTDFLAERRRLLAGAGNEFLERLMAGHIPEPVAGSSEPQAAAIVPGDIDSEQEELELKACNAWVAEHGLPEGHLIFELADPTTGQPLANLDLAWPDGLQPGLSQPVALLIGEGDEIEEIVNAAGYRFFTSVERFKAYVWREILAAEPVGAVD